MMIGEISFCDQVGFNIKSDETKRFILDNIQHKYGLKIITKHFDRYEDRVLPNLQRRPHLLCIRSNGNPYFLYLTRLNFVNYCIFIDKKIQQGYSYPRMIISHFKFDDTVFEDTIMDGEMVKTSTGRWTYLLNDILVFQGQHLTDHNLVKRLNILYMVLDKSFTPDMLDICNILVKKYFKYDEAMHIVDTHINTVDYSCRGIYFRPLFLRFKDILINFDDNLITKVERTKYKHLKSFMLKEDGAKLLDPETASVSSNSSALSHHSETSVQSRTSSSTAPGPTHVPVINITTVQDAGTQLYHTRKTSLPDVYELLSMDMKVIGVCGVPSIKISKYLRELFAHRNIVDTIPIRYTYSANFKKWLPVIDGT